MSNPKSAYTKRLDKTKPFGEVHPPWNGMHYEQDGFPFDNDGYIVEEHLTPEQRSALPKRAAVKPAAAAPPPGKSDPAPEPTEAGEADDEPESDDLNLELWAKGEAEYPFGDVQAATKARLHKWCTSKVDLVAFLVEEKIVAKEDLSPAHRKLIGE